MLPQGMAVYAPRKMLKMVKMKVAITECRNCTMQPERENKIMYKGLVTMTYLKHRNTATVQVSGLHI